MPHSVTKLLCLATCFMALRCTSSLMNATSAHRCGTVSTRTLCFEYCSIDVQGEVELKVPSGSQPGDQLVMRGRGIKKINSAAFGTQYVNLNVKIPK